MSAIIMPSKRDARNKNVQETGRTSRGVMSIETKDKRKTCTPSRIISKAQMQMLSTNTTGIG